MDNRLAIVLFTCCSPERGEYAERTIRSTLDNLDFEDGDLYLHIADDGSPPGQVDRIAAVAVEAAAGKAYHFREITVTDSGRRGYGASYNMATYVVHDRTEFILALEDDWELRRRLAVRPLMRAIAESGGHLSCIRLGYIGYTQELRGRFAYYGGQQFLMLDPDSPERHVFSGGPRLETVAFERAVGLWPEGLDAGATEFEVAGRKSARVGIAWPLDILSTASQSLNSTYAHIGTIQARTDQLPV